MRIAFITWMGYHRRSDLLARRLGASAHFIHFGQPGRPWQAPVKYPVEALRTWRLLHRERPDVVFVQNPPIFCAVVAYLYARRCGAGFAIDSHSGAFLDRRWRWSLGLHRLLSRQALVTIVHNKSQEEIVGRWECRYCMVAFVPGDFSAAENYPLDGGFNVAVISSFASDEPVGIVLETAARLPDVTFHVTGDSRRIPRSLLKNKPDNCRLTGYLPYARYVGLLRGVDAIAALSTRNHTLLMGGFEAVSLGKPLLVSDWPLLRDYFSLGAVYVPNTVEGLCEGVQRVRGHQAELQRGILALKKELEEEWERKFTQLQGILAGV